MQKEWKETTILIISTIMLSIGSLGHVVKLNNINKDATKIGIELANDKLLNTEDLRDKIKNTIIEKELHFSIRNNKGLR